MDSNNRQGQRGAGEEEEGRRGAPLGLLIDGQSRREAPRAPRAFVTASAQEAASRATDRPAIIIIIISRSMRAFRGTWVERQGETMGTVEAPTFWKWMSVCTRPLSAVFMCQRLHETLADFYLKKHYYMHLLGHAQEGRNWILFQLAGLICIFG